MNNLQLSISTRVRYAETDQMGYVYHGNYAAFFEMGRVHFLREIGLNYSDLEHSGIMLPVLNLACQYHAPALFDDEIQIITELAELPSDVRIKFNYKILNQAQKLLTTGSTELVFVSTTTRKPIRCPEFFREKIQDFFKA